MELAVTLETIFSGVNYYIVMSQYIKSIIIKLLQYGQQIFCNAQPLGHALTQILSIEQKRRKINSITHWLSLQEVPQFIPSSAKCHSPSYYMPSPLLK